jgi:hypothetical protein
MENALRRWMRLVEDGGATLITEGRDAPLYHGASFFGAISIIKANEIEASTSQDRSVYTVSNRPSGDHEQPVHGVSLTRNKRTAFDFGWVVFEIDQRKLAQTNRMLPLDYWSADDPRSKKPTKRGPNQHPLGDRYESEEFCVGPIKPLNRYLKAIYMTTRGQSALEHQFSPDQIAPLLNHPLLKIV